MEEPKWKKNKRAYDNNYCATHYKMNRFATKLKEDNDIINILENCENRTQFIKDAIRFYAKHKAQ